jgi:hypothetical protein
MKKTLISFLGLLPLLIHAQSQPAVVASSNGYWQQRVKYTMDVNVDDVANQFKGKQKLEYFNNSPDTLTKLYYYLFWNAFQPGSMMDTRSIRQGGVQLPRGVDWDNRVKDRISKLSPTEIGYQHVLSLKVNGKPQTFKTLETILEVKLDKPILPRSKALLEMEFEAQVPVQIRRSGRDNAEGVRFSMSQWYPKLCEYDRDGWHPIPYIAREFYGVWGDYDVTLHIDKRFVVGGTGYLQNPNQVGHGYEAAGAKVILPAGQKLTWHFIAPNVHDFVWAADTAYIHNSKTVRDGLVLHSFYKIDPEKIKKMYDGLSATRKAEYKNNPDNFVAFYKGQWDEVLDVAALMLPYMEKTFGRYAWNQYSFIQGGDGGMEYPMATLLKGAGPDVVSHEWMHSWYQGMLATNEYSYPWMDEGFANYADSRVLNWLFRDTAFAQAGNYRAYYALAKSNREEPLTTPGDHFNTNYAYSNASYSKGSVFLEQLGYIVGAATRDQILLNYYNQWKFKHPDASEFFRVAERTSGLKLDWYREYWINSTKTIDYGIDSLWQEGSKTKIRLSRTGLMPMPIDLVLTFKDGTKELHYIPLDLMYGEKPAEDPGMPRKVYEPWRWTSQVYTVETNRALLDMVSAEIDPTQRLADLEKKNNRLELKW